MKYLVIKNWDLYQPDDWKKNKNASQPYIKDYTDKEFDTDYIKLTDAQRYLLDALCRMRGRVGHDIPYDLPWIIRLLHLPHRNATRVPLNLKRLIEVGFLIEVVVSVPAEGTDESGELPDVRHDTVTRRSDDRHDTVIVPSHDRHDTVTIPSYDAQTFLGQENQQLALREREGKGEKDKESREKEREDRLTAVVPITLRDEPQGDVAKGKAAQ